LHYSIQNFDICANALAFVALLVVVLALEPWVAGLFPLPYSTEKVLKGCVQILNCRLQRCGIYFPQPWQFLFECGETFVLLESCGGFSGFPVLFLSLGEKVVEYIPTAPKITENLFLLNFGWV
jgi:hypothetical protein